MTDEMINGLPEILLRASIAMALTGLAVILILKLLRLRSPALHRIAWVVVLVQGCVFARFALEVPWYPPTQTASTESDQTAVATLGEDVGKSESTTADEFDSAQAFAPNNHAGLASGEPERHSDTVGQTDMGSTAGFDTTTTGGTAFKSTAWFLPSFLLATLQKMSPVKVLTIVWIAGVSIFVMVHLGAYLMLLTSLRRTAAAKREWARQWNMILCRAGVRRPIPLRIHESLGPLLCRTPGGYQVVVPRELWEELDGRQRAGVLNHELAHYRRGDIWKSFLARLVALPHWFNPVAWLAVRKFDETGEWACDRYLIQQDPHRGAAFADALLKIVQFPKPAGIGLSGAGSSELSERVRRLCGVRIAEDSRVKRSTSILLMLVVFAFGLAEIRLVTQAIAQEQEPANAEAQDEAVAGETDQDKIRALADRLVVNEDDPLLGGFRSVIVTRPGETALLERASRMEESARQAAQENALPAFLDQHFERVDGQLALSANESGFREANLKQANEYRADVDEIQAALSEYSEKLGDEDEAAQMLKRFLDHPLAAWVIYATEASRRMRPDERTILEMYQNVFVVNSQGDLIIRPGVRARIEEQLSRSAGRRKALERIREELQALSAELSDVDETHRKLKEVFLDKYFVAFCCYDSIGQNGDPERGMENLFNYFERILEDHSDGLRLNEAGRETVETRFSSFANRKEAAMRLEEPLRQFAQRIPEGYDELHDKVRKAFNSELVLAMLTSTPTMRATNGKQYVQFSIGQQLNEGDDGRMHVRQDQQQQVTDYARRMLRTTRTLRRRFAAVDDQIDSIGDTSLRELFQSPAGKYLMIRSVSQQVAQRQFDGLGMWIGQHFSETDEGLVLNEQSRAEINELLEQVKSIQAELEKDDF